MSFPKKARFVVIGAGIHGLSTAWHLAEKIKKKNGNSTNNDIVVIAVSYTHLTLPTNREV